MPSACPLVGALTFGNLCKECGVVDRLSDTMQNALINIVTIFLGLSVGATAILTSLDEALSFIKILVLGMIAFSFATAGGVLVGKLMCKLTKGKVNPMIGAAGISAFPMSGRTVHKMGLAEDPQNFLLMHSIGVNVSGQIASVIAGGLILNFFM